MNKPDLYLAWCRTCKKARYIGRVFRYVGWPYCGDCKITDMNNPQWPGTLLEFVPPLEGNENVLRVWDEEVVSLTWEKFFEGAEMAYVTKVLWEHPGVLVGWKEVAV
jgi:hypothetical protein